MCATAERGTKSLTLLTIFGLSFFNRTAAGVLTSLVTAHIALNSTSDTRATLLSLASTAFRGAQAASPPIGGLLFHIGGFSLLYGTATAAAFAMLGLVHAAWRTRPGTKN